MNIELDLAIQELKLRGPDRVWFIPVKISACKIPGFDIGLNETLLDLQLLDLTKNWDAGIQRLITVIKGAGHPYEELRATLESLNDVEKHVLLSMYSFFGTSYFTMGDVRDRTFYTERLSTTLYNHMVRGLIEKNLNEETKTWEYRVPDAVVSYIEEELQ